MRIFSKSLVLLVGLAGVVSCVSTAGSESPRTTESAESEIQAWSGNEILRHVDGLDQQIRAEHDGSADLIMVGGSCIAVPTPRLLDEAFENVNAKFGEGESYGPLCVWKDRLSAEWSRSEVSLVFFDESQTPFFDQEMVALWEMKRNATAHPATVIARIVDQPIVIRAPLSNADDLDYYPITGWLDASGLEVRTSVAAEGVQVIGASAEYYARVLGRWIQLTVSGLAATDGSKRTGEVGVNDEELSDLEARLSNLVGRIAWVVCCDNILGSGD